MWIEPRGFEEIHQRGNVQQHRLQDPGKWVPFGVGAIEGHAREPLAVLEPAGDDGDRLTGGQRAATDTNAGVIEPGDVLSEEQRAAGVRPVYGPGEEPRPRDGEPTGSAHGELL